MEEAIPRALDSFNLGYGTSFYMGLALKIVQKLQLVGNGGAKVLSIPTVRELIGFQLVLGSNLGCLFYPNPKLFRTLNVI